MRFACATLAVLGLGLTLLADSRQVPRNQTLRGAPQKPAPSGVSLQPQPQSTLIDRYCLGCHNDKAKTGGLTLATFDAAHPELNAAVAEKMIRKLRAGMMPPVGARRPDMDSVKAFVAALETRIDNAAAQNVNPGRRTFQRLNRTEYERSIHDLLAIDIDVDAFLPPDTISRGFDTIADVQSFSPTLMQGYLRAADKISRLAVGDPDADPSETTYKVPRTASQLKQVDGAPFGTRGGIAVVHNFPADGEYRFRMMLHGTPTGQLFGLTTKGEEIEVSVNGERVALLEINPRMSESDKSGLNLLTPPIHVKAGPQRVSAAFLERSAGPVDDLLAPIEHTLADSQIGDAQGITTLPHLRDFSITGPYRVTGVSDTPSRRKIFTCRPTAPGDEIPCARQIISQLASAAYRRPAASEDVEALMTFYGDGRKSGRFESGIRTALQAILASPHFLFRLEAEPANVRPGQNYRISDLDLASRLSYFLWATAPDAELVRLATQRTLGTRAVLEKQVRRMLADPRSEALATRFAAQWLRLQDLDKIHPDALMYPQYDQVLAASMRRETELFVENLVRDDRSVLELLTANYTFVNERLARHYGIANLVGPQFRRVELPDENRRGLLGHGSILTLTSVADRTSPVQRGKWIMEVLLGSPPPPPPPNVPALEETKAVAGDRLLAVRERMEEHRKSPACSSCHRVIDPLGLALENFDVTGAWRIRDNGVPIDASGQLYDGTELNGPVSLRQALMNHSDVFIRTFTENLMAYGIGRRVEYYDMPAIRAIVQKAAQNENRLSSFILGVVNSAAFQMSRAEETSAAAGPADNGSRK